MARPGLRLLKSASPPGRFTPMDPPAPLHATGKWAIVREVSFFDEERHERPSYANPRSDWACDDRARIRRLDDADAMGERAADHAGNRGPGTEWRSRRGNQLPRHGDRLRRERGVYR